MTTHKLIDPKEAIAIINREFGLCIDAANPSLKSVTLLIDYEGAKVSVDHFCFAPIEGLSTKADEQ